MAQVLSQSTAAPSVNAQTPTDAVVRMVAACVEEAADGRVSVANIKVC